MMVVMQMSGFFLFHPVSPMPLGADGPLVVFLEDYVRRQSVVPSPCGTFHGPTAEICWCQYPADFVHGVSRTRHLCSAYIFPHIGGLHEPH